MQRIQPREFNASSATPRRSDGLGAARYGVGGVVVLTAVVVLVIVPGGIGFISAMAGSAMGAVLLMLLLNLLYRLSIGGDREPQREGDSGRCRDEHDEQTPERPTAYRSDLARERDLAKQGEQKGGRVAAHRIPQSFPETR